MKRYLSIIFLLLAFSLLSHAQKDTLFVSSKYTTHVIFSSDVTYADLSNSRSIAAKIVEQNKNMIALMAREPFDRPCSVSALESSGRIWTYIVVYREDPDQLIIDTRPEMQAAAASSSGGAVSVQGGDAPRKESVKPDKGQRKSAKGNSDRATKSRRGAQSAWTWKPGQAPLLQDVLKRPRSLYHIGEKMYDVTVSCDNIFSYSDITYITLTVKNGSGISFNVNEATFVVESRKRNKRTVSYDTPVFPKNRHGSLSAGPSSSSSIVYTFDKLTLSKSQVLRVYLYEESGQRNLVMTVMADDINRAKSLL